MLFLISAFTGTASAVRFNEWQGAGSLEELTVGSNSTSPVVDFDQFGRGVSAWNWEFGGVVHVRASYYDPLTGWSEPVVLDRNGILSTPVVAIDDLGNAIVGWTETSDEGLVVYGSAREVDGSWVAPSRLTADGYDEITGLTAVVNNVSHLMVCFAGQEGNIASIMVSNYRTVFGFDPQASVLVNMTDQVLSLSAGSNGKSDTWLVWSRLGGGDYLVEGIRFDMINWVPDPISLAGPGAIDPQIAVDLQGRATLIYQVNDPEQAVLEIRNYQDYNWYGPARLLDQAGNISQLELVMSPAGNVSVAALVNSSTVQLMVADFNGTTWKGFAPLPGIDGSISSFDLAMTAAGSVMVVFETPALTETDLYTMHYASREAGGNWTGPVEMPALGSGAIQQYYSLAATRGDYWLVFSRFEIGTTGESRVWADQFYGLQKKGALLQPYFYGLNSTVSTSLVEVAGWIEPYSSVTVNDQTVVADKYGHFSAFIPLEVGNNTVEITTVDSLGRSAHVTVYVIYDPNVATVSGLWIAGIGTAVLAATVGVLYLFLRRR